MENFRVPLEVDKICKLDTSPGKAGEGGVNVTLSSTFSSEWGESMAKQTNRTSVSGYDNGRRRSYSSCPAVSHNASSTVLPLDSCVLCVM